MIKKALSVASSCGIPLTTSVVECSDGATDMLISFVKSRYDARHALVVCDANTCVFTDKIISSLSCSVFVLPGNSHADEIHTEMLSSYISQNGLPSVMIAVGSGSVHDIVRFCAHEAHVEMISYPTASSVDGFVSGVAAMTMHGQKLTYPSTSPVALFADPSVYRSAPSRLCASGVGDVIGKITALFDWEFSHIITGEALNVDIYNLMKSALDRVIEGADKGGDEFVDLVMEGLILSGLAMQLAGSSRPASGSEHHMSHFWEMHVANPPTDALHGEKVGVGTILMLSHIKANAEIASRDIDIDISKIYSRDIVEPIYGSLTDGIINENIPNGVRSSALAKLGRSSLPANFEILEKLIFSLPTPDVVKSLLAKVGAPVSLSELSLPDNDDFVSTSLYYSPYVRNRLTFSKVISAINISERLT